MTTPTVDTTVSSVDGQSIMVKYKTARRDRHRRDA